MTVSITSLSLSGQNPLCQANKKLKPSPSLAQQLVHQLRPIPQNSSAFVILLFQPLVKTMHFSARLLVYSHS